MDIKQTGINFPVCFAGDAISRIAHLAQAVFVNLNKFNRMTP